MLALQIEAVEMGIVKKYGTKYIGWEYGWVQVFGRLILLIRKLDFVT